MAMLRQLTSHSFPLFHLHEIVGVYWSANTAWPTMIPLMLMSTR